jgi:hypothetical protein
MMHITIKEPQQLTRDEVHAIEYTARTMCQMESLEAVMRMKWPDLTQRFTIAIRDNRVYIKDKITTVAIINGRWQAVKIGF